MTVLALQCGRLAKFMPTMSYTKAEVFEGRLYY
jgi:hypothetical protein